MSNFKWEKKSNATATEGRVFTGSIDGIKKTVNDIRYSINVPTFNTLQDFCNEVGEMSEQGKINLLSLVTVAISNAYMNKATELVARDIPVEDFTLEQFFTMSGNREGVGKAIEQAEEALVQLASEKMELLAQVNGILADVFSSKITMPQAQELQAELTAQVAECDREIKEVTERLQKLEVIKEEQAIKNKARGLAAAASRKANAEVVTTKELDASE